MRRRRAEFNRAPGVGSLVVLLAIVMLLGTLMFSADSSQASSSQAASLQSASLQTASLQTASLQTQCPEGEVLSSNGVTCEIDPTYQPPCPDGEILDPTGLRCEPIQTDSPCPFGEKLDAAGLNCIPDEPANDSPCPPGQVLDAAGIRCIADVNFVPDSQACEPGFEVAADGETCVAVGPTCGPGEVLDTDGTCTSTFSCSEGLILTSDLLSCVSGGCPDDELLSVDGSRCVAKDTTCPDGSPRPVGGACLVVDVVENADGTTEVTVRCDPADLFCQALINECAEQKAAGSEAADADCADPRTSCPEGDQACEEANERLVDCATADAGVSDDDSGDSDGGSPSDRRNPCDDLCPRLHRLDVSGECVEYLDPTHPCVSFGRVPTGVTTNAELDRYSYLAGTGQCVTRVEFLRRLANFEAAAGAELDALELLRATTSTYLTVEEQLAELQLQLVVADAAVATFTAAAAEADLERDSNEKLLVETRKQLQRERERLRAEVLEVFTRGGNDVAVAKAVLSAETITEIGVSRVYGRALLADQVRILERVVDLEIETEALGQALELAAAEVEASLAEAVEATDEISRLLELADALRAEQLARRDEEAALVSVLREDKAEFAPGARHLRPSIA